MERTVTNIVSRSGDRGSMDGEGRISLRGAATQKKEEGT